MKARTSARSPETAETEDGFVEEGLPGELSREKKLGWCLEHASELKLVHEEHVTG
jgi:hypothetical protein